MNSISVVIPVFNSARVLPELARRLFGVLTGITKDFEVILVDDGSPDNSWPVICELAGQFPWICGIKLLRNYGQHNALLCGIRAAQYEVIITMDDDLQHPPEEIPKLLDKLAEGYDVVYGTPKKGQHQLWRVVASQVGKLVLQSAMGAETARKVSAFRAFQPHLCDAFANYQGPFVSIDVLLTWGTTRFATREVWHEPRNFGTSNYNFRKLMAHTLNMMTGFSTLPLQLASFIGFAFTVFGLGVLAFVIGRYLIEDVSVPGFAFLASIIAIFSGAQLFALGIIGEYLARMHFRMLERPNYVVRCSTRAETSADHRTLSVSAMGH